MGMGGAQGSLGAAGIGSENIQLTNYDKNEQI